MAMITRIPAVIDIILMMMFVLILRLPLTSLGIEQLWQLIRYSITHRNITMEIRILTILFVIALAKSATPLNCFSCSLNPETGSGECSDTEHGNPIDCSNVDTSGQFGDLSCIIRQAEGGVRAYDRTCVKVEPESLGCSETGMEGEEEHTCYCKTDLCNENWDTAGDSTTTASATPTTSNGDKTLSCYQCSLDPETGVGECSDTEYGNPIDCSKVDTSGQFGDLSCVIQQAMGEVQAYDRTCAKVLPESLGCSKSIMEGEVEHTCYCKTDLCNKNWDTAGDSTTTTSATPTTSNGDKTLSCYHCSEPCYQCSCDESHYGESVDCSQVDLDGQTGELGCLIQKTIGGDPYFTRACVKHPPENFGCTNSGEEGEEEHMCYCKTDLCNENWETAGDGTTTPSATPTTSNGGKTLSCYQCSLDPETGEGSCDETHYGESVDCSQVDLDGQTGELGCVIQKTIGGILEFTRACVKQPPENFGCTNTGEEGEEEHTCYCKTDLCNKNWDTAGDSTTTTTPVDYTTTTSATTTSGAEALSLHSGVLIALIIIFQ